MTTRCRTISVVALLVLGCVGRAEPDQPSELEGVRQSFKSYSGISLVFAASELPAGKYHDVMNPLPERDQLRAARITLAEVRKYPPGYLGKIGLKAIGVFASCVSRDGDGFRLYDKDLQGYRYYGIYNGKNAVTAAFYTEGQLPLTIHHEIFHHVDATRNGTTDARTHNDADSFADAISGKNPAAAPKFAVDDLAALRKRGAGAVLETVVSDYCKKNPGEDKAETARYFMSHLSDALVQVATRPELPGSQRILHILGKYERAPANAGPGIDWFVDLALDRTESAAPANPYLAKVDAAVADLPTREAIRRVQPACVRLGQGSGVNIGAGGRILTAAHVPQKLGSKLTARFPDGREYTATCTAIDQRLDLAVMSISTTDKLPFAALADAPPEKDSRVICIGQPGSTTPDGKPTNYQPFHVSVGAIRGFLDDPLGDQTLGRTKHDAWTYWGHSGSPLFNEAGRIVALHNSWDSKTAMRHAVTQQAIADFLKRSSQPPNPEPPNSPATTAVPRDRERQELTLTNEAQPAGKNANGVMYYSWTAHVQGSPELLRQIKFVRYHLHKSFNPSEQDISTDAVHGFPLSTSGWGRFELKATVFFQDGSTKELRHRLKFGSE